MGYVVLFNVLKEKHVFLSFFFLFSTRIYADEEVLDKFCYCFLFFFYGRCEGYISQDSRVIFIVLEHKNVWC